MPLGRYGQRRCCGQFGDGVGALDGGGFRARGKRYLIIRKQVCRDHGIGGVFFRHYSMVGGDVLSVVVERGERGLFMFEKKNENDLISPFGRKINLSLISDW